METSSLDTELSILTRLVSQGQPDFPPDVARAILSLSFPQQDIDRMNELADKVQESPFIGQECSEVESYRRVGHWLSIMKSRARRSLAAAGMEPKASASVV
jgi:hypothetical protein